MREEEIVRDETLRHQDLSYRAIRLANHSNFGAEATAIWLGSVLSGTVNRTEIMDFGLPYIRYDDVCS